MIEAGDYISQLAEEIKPLKKTDEMQAESQGKSKRMYSQGDISQSWEGLTMLNAGESRQRK